MKQLAFGDKRTANARADVESRLARLENVVQQFPSRIGSGQQQARRFRVTKTAHGWTRGTWIIGTPGSPLVWITATITDQNFDNLAIVTHVVDADHVMAACGPGLIDASWLNTSDSLFGSVKYLGTAGGYASTHQTYARPTHANLNDGWVWLYGPGFYSAIEFTNLQHLNDTNINGTGNLLTDGQPLIWNSSQSRWINGAVGAAGLPSIAGLSVLGRAANSTGTVAAITGSTTGQVLQVGATTLQWAQLATASYGDGSVTAVKLATDVVLGSLHDTSVATPADLNFLRWNAGTSKWTKYDLGAITYVINTAPALPELALDGGVSGTAMVVGIGATGSRIMLGGPNTVGLDFLLSGAVNADTDKSARIKNVSATQISFYDQATRTSAGTEVMRWTVGSTPNTLALRYCSLSLNDGTPGHAFIALNGSSIWGDAVGSGANASLFGGATTWTLDAGNTASSSITIQARGNGSSITIQTAGTSSPMTLTATGALSITAGGTGATLNGSLTTTSGNVSLAGGGSFAIGFYGSAGTTKPTVTGSRGGNAALASALTALANLGLLTDSST